MAKTKAELKTIAAAVAKNEAKIMSKQLPDPPAEIIVNLENNEKENTMETTITRVQMISTAKQMNRIFSYTPEEAINVKGEAKGGLTDDVLKSFIIDNGTQLEATDFEFHDDDADFIPFDDDAKAVFTAFGVLIPLKPPVVVKNEMGRSIGVVNTADKTADELKEEIRLLKLQLSNSKKVKTPKADKYTRSHAIVDAIKISGTRDELIASSNRHFLDHNPNVEDGKTTARDMLNYVMPTLLILKIVSFDETTKIFSPAVISE